MEEEKPKKDVPKDANKGCPGFESEKAGQQDSCKGCPNQNKCKSGELKKALNQTKDLISENLS